MIRIGRLRLKNFKSFRKANIPFHSGFTAIAGSNASGKSNLVDAILFAFGITSLKMLRASKLTDLVNHDADEPYAKVELELQGGEKTYVISRKIDKEGRSVMLLDGKKRSLNEVTTLLLELGIKATGQNIVVQGDITRVIEMSAKERRKIIDDMAGLSEFEGKKEEALKKLEAVDRRVKDAMIVLGEREQYLAELEKEREAVLKYNTLNEELRRSKATLLNAEIIRVRAELASAKKKGDALAAELEGARKEKAGLGAEVAELEKKLDETIKNILRANEKTYEEIGKGVEEKRSEVRLARERISAKEEEIARNRARIEALKEKRKGLIDGTREKEEALRGARDKLKEMDAQLAELNRIIGKKSGKVSAAGAKAAEDEKALEEARERAGKIKGEIYRLDAEVGKMRHALETAKSRLAELKKREDALSADVKKLERTEKRIAELREMKIEGKARDNHKALEAAIDALHGAKNAKRVLEDEIRELKIAQKNCPVCDRELGEKLKEAISKKKAALLTKVGAEAEARAAEREKLSKEREKLEELLHEERAAVAEAAGLERSRNALRDVERAAAGIDLKALQAGVNAALAEKGAAEKSVVAAEATMSALAKKVEAFRKSEENTEMSGLIGRIESANAQKSELQNKAAKLEAWLESAAASKAETEAEMEKAGELNSKGSAFADAQRHGLKKLEEELAKKDAELEKARKETRMFEEEKGRITNRISNIGLKRDEAEAKAERLGREINELNLSQSKNDVRIADMELEFEQHKGEKLLKEFSVPKLRERIPSIEREIKALGAINMKATENFDSYRNEVVDLRERAKKLDEERLAVVEMIDKIDVKKNQVFTDCFARINNKFMELYSLFFEGEGRLGLTDSVNPLEGGLTIEAKYKGEKLKSIDAMSGGEKSLAALAFLFAIQSFETAPFYIFDEVDAALDKDNSLKLGRMIGQMSRRSQFISITHNDTIISEADQLVGVTLNKQKSSVVGLRLRQGETEGLMRVAARENGEAAGKGNAKIEEP
ncbi:MAG: AAA family ATPase [Candidatus Diapherotrites archaeon]